MTKILDSTIQDRNSCASTSDHVEFLRTIRKSLESDSNTLHISKTGSPLPALMIFVYKNYGVLYFLPDSDVAGFRSLGNSIELAAGEDFGFFDHFSETPLHITASDNAIIPKDIIPNIALEFAMSNRKPECIRWLEL